MRVPAGQLLFDTFDILASQFVCKRVHINAEDFTRLLQLTIADIAFVDLLINDVMNN